MLLLDIEHIDNELNTDAESMASQPEYRMN
jgi:hypothetical protein